MEATGHGHAFARVTRRVIIAAAVGALTLGVWVAWRTWRAAEERQRILDRANWVWVALHDYEDVMSELPPAQVPCKNGQGTNSWRLALLPYFGSSDLPSPQYWQERNWDSSETQAWGRSEAGKHFAMAYCWPNPSNARVLAMTGNGTAWDRERYKTFADLPANSIVFLVVPESEIPWWKPRDLTIEELAKFQPTTQGQIIGIGFAGRKPITVDATVPVALLLKFANVEQARAAEIEELLPYAL